MLSRNPFRRYAVPALNACVLGLAVLVRAEPPRPPVAAVQAEKPRPAAPREAASVVAGAPSSTAPPAAPLAKVALVRFDEPESQARFERSRAKVDFFKLANQFEAQENGGFCGLASGVIVLNALRVDRKTEDKPRDTSSIAPDVARTIPPQFDPFFARYTQGTFMDARFESVNPRAVFFGQPRAPGQKPEPGLALRELGAILQAHGLSVVVHPVEDPAREKEEKAEIVQNLRTAGDYVIVNYHRPELGQPGGGHLSPLGAYDKASDSFLVLDVNANAQRWVWAPAKALFVAMRTRGGSENRGYLLVKEKGPE
ncbi:MAG TPA: phytochelatin synthase family protein [Polyangiaceae bacterium]|nr:phytochelatin synthase family protein [Polyangiaceae bacterium]